MANRATPIGLSHHPPEQYSRCIRLGRWHLCRRCTVLYPTAAAAAVATALLLGSQSPLDLYLLFLLPLPAVVDWWLEHLDRVSYSPIRQLVVTFAAGVGLGRGFTLYLADPSDPLFWSMVLIYGGTCAAISLWRFIDQNAP